MICNGFLSSTPPYEPNKLHRLDLLKNRHRGERCILVANGPSLNGMDLSCLKHEIVIGLNKIHLGLKRLRFYPRYLVAVNDKVIEQAANEMLALNCVKFISQRSASKVPESALTYHIDTNSPSSRFCKDISQGVHEGWTVSYAAMQIAYHLGFDELIIIGMDHRYEFSGAPNQASILEGSDPNHFDENYFGHGKSWDNPDLVRSEESYKIARSVYEADGRRILDATVNGACNVFDKVNFKEVMR